MPDERYDLVVIGGGSAGLTAAGFGAAIGATVLIATENVGGDCTWSGCIPSKALIHAARVVHDAAVAASTSVVTVDFARIITNVRATIDRVYTYEAPEQLAKRGIKVAIGTARFVDGESILVGERRIAAGRFIVCTGATPVIPQIPGLERVAYHTYENFFDSDRLPASMVVLGAGATGLELGQAMARLGSKVTMIDERAYILPDADPEASALIESRLKAEGIAFILSSRVSEVSATEAQVELRVGDARFAADSLLVAAGRRPRITGPALERAGIEVQDGAVRVDKTLRTTNPRVHAAGDVTGGFQFTHYAGWQGYVAARNALLPGSQDGVRANIPWVVFTDPEIAHAGVIEGDGLRIHRMHLGRVDRAQTEGDRDGFLKLLTTGSGKLVGATVVSRAAGETINELALAIDRGLTLSDLASTIHAYPTYGLAIQQLAAEASLEAAAGGVCGRAIHALRRLS